MLSTCATVRLGLGHAKPKQVLLDPETPSYASGLILIKVGSVHPHGRGCTVWDSKGLLPTQRCVGGGPAGATGLVLREGVVTQVTLEESPVLSAHTSNYRELLTVYAGIRRSRQLHVRLEVGAPSRRCPE
jgi:hypothetical protein